VSSRAPHILRTVALLVAACFIATACTARQSQAQYEERLERALDARDETSDMLSGGGERTPETFDAASDKVSSALDELDADPPPRNLQPAHDRMVEAMEALAILLDRLGRCEALKRASDQDARACRQSIGQDVYDDIRNDFNEANTIYRQEGLSLARLGGGEDGGGADDSLDEEPAEGDEL
jgi:hypothetical protein